MVHTHTHTRRQSLAGSLIKRAPLIGIENTVLARYDCVAMQLPSCSPFRLVSTGFTRHRIVLGEARCCERVQCIRASHLITRSCPTPLDRELRVHRAAGKQEGPSSTPTSGRSLGDAQLFGECAVPVGLGAGRARAGAARPAEA